MRRWLCLGSLIVAGWATGCATTSEDAGSSIPWNRPQSWEGTGALGGMVPTSR